MAGMRREAGERRASGAYQDADSHGACRRSQYSSGTLRCCLDRSDCQRCFTTGSSFNNRPFQKMMTAS